MPDRPGQLVTSNISTLVFDRDCPLRAEMRWTRGAGEGTSIAFGTPLLEVLHGAVLTGVQVRGGGGFFANQEPPLAAHQAQRDGSRTRLIFIAPRRFFFSGTPLFAEKVGIRHEAHKARGSSLRTATRESSPPRTTVRPWGKLKSLVKTKYSIMMRWQN